MLNRDDIALFKRNSSRGGQKAGAARTRAMWQNFRETGVKTPSLVKAARANAAGQIAVLQRKLNEWDKAFAAQALEMIASTPDRAALLARFTFLMDNTDSHEGFSVWAHAESAARNLLIAEG